MEIIQRLYRDTSGAALVEYALLVTFIALVAVAAVQALGVAVLKPFGDALDGFPT